MTVRAQRITFPGSMGTPLAARLDLPAGPPRAYVLFAHCFTCSKDLRAASRIATALTEAGDAVLRFDFTGLGSSEGEFSNTNFTSNVDDLVAAAAWLRDEHRAPQLLVGHSLGGAAAIVAARSIPEVRAVATIGAPSDTAHIGDLFSSSRDEIERNGSAEVVLAGRTFRITRQFLDDMASHVVGECAATLDAALLLMHSPIDETVSIDHAARLYTAARHPKSFIALDGASHLLDEVDDAEFAARMIGNWSARYAVDDSGIAPPPAPTAQVVVAETTQGTFMNHVVSGRHRFLADEPESIGGFDAGPSPYDLLAAALGTCTSMTVRMYAARKQLALHRVRVEVTHDKVHGVDAVTAEAPTGGYRSQAARVDRFTRVLHLEGDLTEEQRERLREIADRCPVHRTLEQSSVIETRLA